MTNPSSTTRSSPSAATVSHRWNWDGSMGKRGGRVAPDVSRSSHAWGMATSQFAEGTVRAAGHTSMVFRFAWYGRHADAHVRRGSWPRRPAASIRSVPLLLLHNLPGLLEWSRRSFFLQQEG